MSVNWINGMLVHGRKRTDILPNDSCAGLLEGELTPIKKTIEPLQRLIDQITMVRNFPVHVGDYDKSLPERRCNSYEEEYVFRDGWYQAITAINDKLTEMQKGNKE
jgi:hypothetical protein